MAPGIDFERCSMPGCCNAWSSNFGRRLCTQHLASLDPPPVRPPVTPTHPPEPHWQDIEPRAVAQEDQQP